MLDSDSYPNANFNIHNFNFSFRNALRKGQKLYKMYYKKFEKGLFQICKAL